MTEGLGAIPTEDCVIMLVKGEGGRQDGEHYYTFNVDQVSLCWRPLG